MHRILSENPFHKLQVVQVQLIGPPREKTYLRDFRQSQIQTSLLSYRD